MELKRYIKDRWIEIVAYTVFGVLMALLLVAFAVNDELLWLLAVLYIMLVCFNLAWDYMRKKQFYDCLISYTEQLDQKYLVLETLEQPQFYEGEMLYQTLYDVNKSMCENVKDYQQSLNDFKEYLEMWVHEAKLPIASMLLMCHNGIDGDEEKLATQLRRLDAYTEQVLYYVRGEHTQSDYLIKEIPLNKLVGKAVRHNREDLLANMVDIEVNHLDMTVMTDSKWMEFVLNQLISNSIKYRKMQGQAKISFYAEEMKDQTVLHIKDNGRGIVDSDIRRVFQKAYTGENGRKRAKSTGMGLYIAKKLCDSLGHAIEIESTVNEGTDVKITFVRNELYKFR